MVLDLDAIKRDLDERYTGAVTFYGHARDLLARVRQLEAALAECRTVMRLAEDDGGNFPGHSHTVLNTWDGRTPCAKCRRWNAAIGRT